MQKLIETDETCLYIENEIDSYLEGIFIHWDIHKWTPSSVRWYKQVWREEIVPRLIKAFKNIYALPPTEKEEKLIRMFRMEYTGLTFNGIKLYKYMGEAHQNQP